MGEILHDSTKTFKPIIYQFYIALEKCFDLLEGESIYIEKYGDVTVSSQENATQIEVKDFESKLTDLDHNLWKTLKNWLNDNFDISQYRSLILLTTQEFGKTTLLKDWDYKDKQKKFDDLVSIATKYKKRKEPSEKTQKLLDEVLDSAKKNKLLDILEKFFISSSSTTDDELYRKLMQSRTDGVIKDKKSNYLDSLMGYIINPEVTSNNWEIKYKDFREKAKSLIEEFNSKTVIFPSIERSEVNEEDSEHSEYTFIQKIEEIEYHKVKTKAISDFIDVRRIIMEEFKGYAISSQSFKNYDNEIYETYSSKYSIASRNTEESKIIRDSKSFFDEITGADAPSFRNFNDTPKFFRNGLLHQMADDDSVNNKNQITWKLEIEDE